MLPTYPETHTYFKTIGYKSSGNVFKFMYVPGNDNKKLEGGFCQHHTTLNFAVLCHLYCSATLTEVLPCFSSVVRHMPGYNSPRRGTASTFPKKIFVLCNVCFVAFCVLNPLLLPTDAHNVKKRGVIRTF